MIIVVSFNGMDDDSIVFAITSDGLKAVLVDEYGVYASSLNDDMIKKLSISR